MKISKIASRPLAVAFGGLVAMVALVALPVAAHHSTAAFDNTRVVRIEGTVTQFRWINPHASFKLEGTADDGPNFMILTRAKLDPAGNTTNSTTPSAFPR